MPDFDLQFASLLLLKLHFLIPLHSSFIVALLQGSPKVLSPLVHVNIVSFFQTAKISFLLTISQTLFIHFLFTLFTCKLFHSHAATDTSYSSLRISV